MIKHLLVAIMGIVLISCSQDETVVLEDHKDLIDANTELAMLNASQNALQDLRLNSLEVRVDDLEVRMDNVESRIDDNEAAISSILNTLDLIDAELLDIRQELASKVAMLLRSDRMLRRELRRDIRDLRRRFMRKLGRTNSRLSELNDTVESHISRQELFNRILSGALFLTNLRINGLSRELRSLERRVGLGLSSLQNQINSINAEIFSINQSLSDLSDQIDDVESRLVSVVYPCGEGNSEEVLLQTQDGLVAYLQKVKTITRTYEVGVTIPEHFVCDKYFFSACLRGRTIPESIATDTVRVRMDVLQRAYLDVLNDGTYRTTDGFSCRFTIEDGEVLND